MAAQQVESCLIKAQAHEEAGRRREAIRAYEEACVAAHEAVTAGDEEKRPDQLLIAGAALGWARVVLQVGGSWPELLGRAPDELLRHALEGAQRARRRSRILEGQIMLERSKALFAKPNKTAADLDAAVQTRYDALPLLQQGAVEALPWKMEQARALMEKASETSCTPVGDEALLLLLRGEMGGGDGVANDFAVLFNSWATQGPSGEAALAPVDFLRGFLEVAKDLDRKVDRPPCAAPCEGGKVEGASPLEQELTALVSRDGDGKWEAKAAEMRMKGADFEGVTAASLQALWRELAPKIKKQVDGDAPMACGHSCSTCPTKDTCQMHDALRDIEDM